MTAPVQLGKRCTIRLVHRGCWASELSQWLHIERPDIEFVVYARSVTDDPSSYRAVAVFKSKEQKEIDKELQTAITEFLLQHKVIRSVKPRLPRPSNYTLILLLGTQDESAPAAIRAVIRHGGKLNAQIGMPIINGVEHVTFFAEETKASAIAAEIQTEYAKNPKIYDVVGIEMKEENLDENQIFLDPYYLPTYILCSNERRKGYLEAAKQGIKEIVAWIYKNAPWLIPLLARILDWLLRVPQACTPPPQIIRYPV